MGLAHWTLAGARLELMIIVSTVNVVLEKRTASSHILRHTRWYKARKEPPICAVGMTPICLMKCIGSVMIWHHSLGIRHFVRWHQPMITTLVREVLPQQVKGVEISPANLMGHVHPVTVILLSTNESVVWDGFLSIANSWLWGKGRQ